MIITEFFATSTAKQQLPHEKIGTDFSESLQTAVSKLNPSGEKTNLVVEGKPLAKEMDFTGEIIQLIKPPKHACEEIISLVKSTGIQLVDGEEEEILNLLKSEEDGDPAKQINQLSSYLLGLGVKAELVYDSIELLLQPTQTLTQTPTQTYEIGQMEGGLVETGYNPMEAFASGNLLPSGDFSQKVAEILAEDTPVFTLVNEKIVVGEKTLPNVNRGESRRELPVMEDVAIKEFEAKGNTVGSFQRDEIQPVKQEFGERPLINLKNFVGKIDELEEISPKEKNVESVAVPLPKSETIKIEGEEIIIQPREIVGQVAKEIKSQLTQYQGKTQFTVTLAPKELGKITIELVSEAGKVSVKITAEQEAVRNLLSTRGEHIQSAIKDTGSVIESYQVANSDPRQQLNDFNGSSKNPYQQQQQADENGEQDFDFAELLKAM